MRRLGIVSVGLSLTVVGLAMPAAAATQFSIWPADYTYGAPGTPASQFAWSATTFGITFEQGLAPLTSFRTNLAYGPTSSISNNGTGLSGFSGGVFLADASFRVRVPAGPLGLTAYGGYGGLFFTARGSGNDGIVLQSSGPKIGFEASMTPAPGVSLRGGYTVTTGLTTSANFVISPPNPPASGSSTGSGTGNEFEIALVLSPVPTTSVYAGYRSGTQQISWSTGASTSNTFRGWMVGVNLLF